MIEKIIIAIIVIICILLAYLMGDFIMNQNKHLDRLYDLIQANLVEKVKE